MMYSVKTAPGQIKVHGGTRTVAIPLSMANISKEPMVSRERTWVSIGKSLKVTTTPWKLHQWSFAGKCDLCIHVGFYIKDKLRGCLDQVLKKTQ